jgi:hypothetical protein
MVAPRRTVVRIIGGAEAPARGGGRALPCGACRALFRAGWCGAHPRSGAALCSGTCRALIAGGGVRLSAGRCASFMRADGVLAFELGPL